MRLNRRIYVLILAIFILTAQVVDAQGNLFDIERIQRATVYIMQARNIGDQLLVSCVSSGTIVSRDGLILTNAHSTAASDTCPGSTLLVAMSIRSGEPPTVQYRAEILQVDIGLDIAILRVVRAADGRLLDRSLLALPFVELADSTSVRLDDTLTIVGYPGLGNDPVQVARGTANGFVTEPRAGTTSPAWIKTGAAISGTMSGGGAYSPTGQLVGIPTTAPIADQPGITTSCLPIQDTNSDGIVNDSDDCIAIGGFINTIRPANFASPLLRAAALNLSLTSPGLEAQINRSSESTPTFSRLFFASSVNEAGMPSTVISSLPSGANSLYLFFDYSGMRPETVYELRVTVDGVPNPTFSLAPVRWSGGERGMWYIGSSGQPWPNGVYEFTLFADGTAARPARLVIGEAPGGSPAFSDITFGVLDVQGNPQGNGFILPTNSTTASGRFAYFNMPSEALWTAIWYFNGTEFQRIEGQWSEPENGSTLTSIRAESTLPPGIYRLELYIEGRLAATSDFTIAGIQQGPIPQVFNNLRFTTASSDSEASNAPTISTFADDLNALYSIFDWSGFAPGTLWTMRWRVDRELFFDQTLPWVGSENGEAFITRLSNPTGLPDGTYAVELLVNNILLARAEARIGIGQLPIDEFARAGGVQLRGQLVDTDTELGIPNVSIIIISEDFSVADFVWDQSQVYATATTDQDGIFEVDRPLQLSTEDVTIAYSMLITAEGYLPVAADGIEVDESTTNPLVMTVYLSRD